MDVIREVEKAYMKQEVPRFSVGDTVDVEVKITEGDKERIQIFNGVVIAFSSAGVRRSFTVRRIVQGEGVERVFPIHSPRIAGVKVLKRGIVRRAKLYHLRGKSGKSARIREKISGGDRDKDAGSAQTPEKKAAEPVPAKA